MIMFVVADIIVYADFIPAPFFTSTLKQYVVPGLSPSARAVTMSTVQPVTAVPFNSAFNTVPMLLKSERYRRYSRSACGVRLSTALDQISRIESVLVDRTVMGPFLPGTGELPATRTSADTVSILITRSKSSPVHEPAKTAATHVPSATG